MIDELIGSQQHASPQPMILPGRGARILYLAEANGRRASTAREALRAALVRHPDVVLLDEAQAPGREQRLVLVDGVRPCRFVADGPEWPDPLIFADSNRLASFIRNHPRFRIIGIGDELPFEPTLTACVELIGPEQGYGYRASDVLAYPEHALRGTEGFAWIGPDPVWLAHEVAVWPNSNIRPTPA